VRADYATQLKYAESKNPLFISATALNIGRLFQESGMVPETRIELVRPISGSGGF
jgi:hypothetical protein